MANDWLQKRIEQKAGKSLRFETERLMIRLSEAFSERMANAKPAVITRAELARRMGVNRSMVTRILSGHHNVTLSSLMSMALALGARLEIDLRHIAAPAENAAASMMSSVVVEPGTPTSDGDASRIEELLRELQGATSESFTIDVDFAPKEGESVGDLQAVA